LDTARRGRRRRESAHAGLEARRSDEARRAIEIEATRGKFLPLVSLY
jgi:hypothetical protein